MEALVSSAPGFTVSDEEMPPRFVALLGRTRRAHLPAILRRLFSEARDQYQAKAFDRAVPQFEKVVALASSPDIRDVEAIADVRLLAEGFIDLAKARPAAAASAPAPAATPGPASNTAAAPAPVVAAGPATRRTTPPVARRQALPPWPADAGPMLGAREGSVRVRINSTGQVTSAAIVRSVNLRYDLKLLEAARFWEYTPATINGVPVESESVVEIKVDPPPAR
jgi:TonB family protein